MIDPVEVWTKLNQRIRLSYYLSPSEYEILRNFILEGGGEPAPVKKIGIDVDNDGVVDKKVSLKKRSKKA